MFTEFFLSLLAGFVFFHQGKHLVGGTAYTSMYFTHVISFYKDLTPTRILQYVVSRTDTIKRILFRLISFPAKLIRRSRQVFYKIYCKQKELVPLFAWADS